ncbi:copper resistance CopC family protein [Brevibacterium jeotgali]|uniref:CopC domain-containing protein n=1 Tax=Brevibacterium jeotgali TaxID=1262550 RepID=A0A2H1L303_9MICO|nr:copper resistance CopC family protein [Brevibacterium jeotgali]TWC02775.1 hypothetical protein FB108_1470 [Brevibacterium jeotgali]SMY10793.1 hypothetical protein BJEO58_00368 [Brevibacterium jeotgali]
MHAAGQLKLWFSSGVLAAVLLGLGLLLSPPAAAHDQMTTSNPEDGAVVDEVPEAIELDFSGELQELGSEIQVTAGDQAVAVDEPVIAGQTITSDLSGEMPAGEYAVAWRVVSSDGHPISGEYSFTVNSGSAGGQEPEPTETEQNAPASDDPAAETAPVNADGELADSGMPLTLVVLLSVGIVAVIAIVAIMLTRKMKVERSDGEQ